jgi:hypothetical protein
MWSLLRVGVVASLVGLSALAQGSEDANPLQIIVLVYNHASVKAATLLAAETTAAKTYEKIGVVVIWKNCPPETDADRCIQTDDLDQLVLNIAHQPQAFTSDTFGVAFSGRDGWGTVCDVYYDRILELHRRFPGAVEATTLGIIMAHELGHLLLGSNSHSATGVMRPVWQYQAFRPSTFGVITFNRQQAQEISDRLRQIKLMARASQ